MPWPCGLVLKNGVKRFDCASAAMPGPVSSIASVVCPAADVSRTVMLPSPLIASMAFFRMLTSACPHGRSLQLPVPGDAAGVVVRCEQPRHALQDRDEIVRPGERRRQAEDVGEATHETTQLLGAFDDDADRLLEVMTVAGRQVSGIRER